MTPNRQGDPPDIVAQMTSADEARAERMATFAALPNNGRGLSAKQVNEAGLYAGGRGIYVNGVFTQAIAPPGVTISLLHTGRHYADALGESGGLFYYPRTHQTTRDANEVEATKNAGRLEIPVFMIIQRKSLRDVRLAWIVHWDDAQGCFDVEFGDELRPALANPQDDSELGDFRPTVRRTRVRTTGSRAVRSYDFSYRVKARCGRECAACAFSIGRVVEGAHVVPVEKNGTDDERNGLPLCPTHHRLLDALLLHIEPNSREFVAIPGGPTLSDMAVTKPSLAGLARGPHPSALQRRWELHGPA